MNQKLKRMIAEHEAGHAVMASILGLPLAFAAVNEMPHASGITQLVRGSMPVLFSTAGDAALLLLHGPDAEQEFTAANLLQYQEDIDSGERTKADWSTPAPGRGDKDGIAPDDYAGWLEVAQSILSRHVLALQAVAGTIERLGTIFGPEVRDLVQRLKPTARLQLKTARVVSTTLNGLPWPWEQPA